MVVVAVVGNCGVVNVVTVVTVFKCGYFIVVGML